jgi:arylsulfatase A-like enzyme
MPDRSNILYFVVHDIGRYAGCYGALVATPAIDAFARSGVTFTNAFCNSPACSPSRICAMTGLYAHTSGGVGLAHMGWPLSQDVPTIVDYLNDAGYETAHSGMEHERHPGQNHYQVELQRHWVHFDTERGVDEALAWLEARDRSRPFYLNVGSLQPHPSTWHKTDTLHGGPVPPEDVYVPPWLPDCPAVRSSFGRFHAAIGYMDRHFGRLVAGLSSLGYDDDTIVVFTTDHGIAAPRAKGTLYDRGVEIALIVRLPAGAFAGARRDELIQNIDFVPTLLEAAGAPRPEPLQGRSFWPLLSGRPYIPNEAIFLERNFHGERRVYGKPGDYVDRYDPVRAVRTPDFHYIRRFDPTVKCRPWLPFEIAPDAATLAADIEAALPPPGKPRPELELYHVAKDPLEFVNVAGRPEFRHVQADLARRLETWLQATDDFVLRGEVPTRPEPPGWGPWADIPDDEATARAQGWFD